jgi:hypothetical protein
MLWIIAIAIVATTLFSVYWFVTRAKKALAEDAAIAAQFSRNYRLNNAENAQKKPQNTDSSGASTPIASQLPADTESSDFSSGDGGSDGGGD